VGPISTECCGIIVYELVPNGEGLIALEILNILGGDDIGDIKHRNPECLHILIETKRLLSVIGTFIIPILILGKFQLINPSRKKMREKLGAVFVVVASIGKGVRSL
jgi:hypothetical protein